MPEPPQNQRQSDSGTLVRWLVMLDPNQRRPGILDREVKRVGEEAARRSAQVVEARTAREAAEAFTCSVWDLRVGLTLHVYKVGVPMGRFHREYSRKGDGSEDWCTSAWPSDPVTVER